jgi:hypothetical protein
MDNAMTMTELGELISRCRVEFWMRTGVPSVKYVRPNIDNRDGRCFSITLEGYGWRKVLHTQNECADLPESLHTRCNAFLNSLAAGWNDKEEWNAFCQAEGMVPVKNSIEP